MSIEEIYILKKIIEIKKSKQFIINLKRFLLSDSDKQVIKSLLIKK